MRDLKQINANIAYGIENGTIVFINNNTPQLDKELSILNSNIFVTLDNPNQMGDKSLRNAIKFYQETQLLKELNQETFKTEDLEFLCKKLEIKKENQTMDNLSKKIIYELSSFQISCNFNVINLKNMEISKLNPNYTAEKVKFGYFDRRNRLRYNLRLL